MRVLTITGKVDSRILAYPLARALSLNGLTAIITDDGSYRRLYRGKESTGTVSGVDIEIESILNENFKLSLKDSGLKYENIIYVTTDFIPTDTTGLIICKGIDKSMYSMNEQDNDKDCTRLKEDTVDIPQGIKCSRTYISFETPPEKKATAIYLKDVAIRYIYSCEERKELQVVEDKSLNKVIANIASQPLGMNAEELFKLLTRKEYLSSKKVK